MKKRYSGVVVPMVTPLNSQLQIDTEAVAKIMQVFAENSISPLILGTTGESASIGKKESAVFVESAVKNKYDNQTIYAGLVGNNVEDLIDSAKLYASLGADAVVVTLPNYYILTSDQIEKFYLTLADKSPCPVMMYNIRSTTQMTIPLEVVERLSHHKNIAGLKDSERDPERLKYNTNIYKDREDFSFFCGWGAQGLGSLQLGADGIVPSTGNIVPETYKKMYDAFNQNDQLLAEEMQKQTDQVADIYQKNMLLGESLAALKVMMEVRGLCKPYMMPPLSMLSKEEIQRVQAATKLIA